MSLHSRTWYLQTSIVDTEGSQFFFKDLYIGTYNQPLKIYPLYFDTYRPRIRTHRFFIDPDLCAPIV